MSFRPYGLNNALLKGCRQILKASQVTEDSVITLLTSPTWEMQHVTNCYYQAALDLGAEVTILMQSDEVPKGEFSKLAEKALFISDYTIGVGVSFFPSYDRTKYKNIMDKLVEEAEHCFFGGTSSPFSTELLISRYPPPCIAVVKRVYPATELLEKSDSIRFTTPNGMDLTMDIKETHAMPELGFVQPDRGHVWDTLGGSGPYYFFNLNSEDTYGKIVIVAGDYPAQIVDRERGFPYMGDKITYTIEDGKIKNIEGGAGATMHRRWFESHAACGVDPYPLIHMGIGTDPRMRRDFERPPYYAVAGRMGEWMDGVINVGVALPPTGAHQDLMMRGGSAWIDEEQILDNETWIGPLSDEALGITEEDKKGPTL